MYVTFQFINSKSRYILSELFGDLEEASRQDLGQIYKYLIELALGGKTLP